MLFTHFAVQNYCFFLTYTIVYATFLHFFKFLEQMEHKMVQKMRMETGLLYIYYVYICLKSACKRYPMAILWVSYGYPMVRVSRG